MPYILNTELDIKKMLKTVGVKSIADLFSNLPAQIKIKDDLNLPIGLSEQQAVKAVKNLAAKNITTDKINSFLGAGCYDHYVPAVVDFVISRSQFLTAYTPYQPECAQGILQTIYEYQSYICSLTGMDVSNASVFDGGTALAEAGLMALRVSGRKKVIVAGTIHPEYRQVLAVYLSGFDFTIEEVGFNKDGIVDMTELKNILDNETACVIIQSPNFFGIVENSGEIFKLAKEKQAVCIMSVNPMSLGILQAPGQLGADIVCGDGQPLGSKMIFGGSSFGFLACKQEFLRQIPGRIVGRTSDKDGKTAYCLTMQTREQHIRREKATSNICSNQSLNAIAATVYLSLMGKDGFRQISLNCLNNTQYLYQRFKQMRGIKLIFNSSIFNEFVWEIENASKVLEILQNKGIIAGYYIGNAYPQFKNAVLTCCTEKKTKEDMDDLVNALAEVLHG